MKNASILASEAPSYRIGKIVVASKKCQFYRQQSDHLGASAQFRGEDYRLVLDISAWFTLWLACAAMSSVSPPLPSGGSGPPRNFVSPPAHPPANVYPTADRHLCPPVHVPVQPPCK